MKLMKLSAMSALALGGLLACGLQASAQTTNHPAAAAPSTNAAPRQNRRPPSLDEQIEHLKAQLKLTDEQVPKVKAVFEESAAKRRELTALPKEEQGARRKALIEEQDKKLQEILNTDQFDKWKAGRAQVTRKAPATVPPATPDKPAAPKQ